MSGFSGGADAGVHSLACGDLGRCRAPCLQPSWQLEQSEGLLSVTAFCLLWDFVCVRRGEVLGGGAEVKDYTHQLPRSKEMHVFSQNQDVVKCYSWLQIKPSNLIDIYSVLVEFLLESIWILGFGPQFKHSSLWHGSFVSVILHEAQCIRLWLNILIAR